MAFLKKYWIVLAGIGVGLLGGFLYWYFVGCDAGTCPITSSPVNSSVYGAAMGGLLFSAFVPSGKTGKKEDN